MFFENIAAIEAALRQEGYIPRREELLAVWGQLCTQVQGVRVLFLEGPPGCGKSELPRALARAMQRPLVMAQATRWCDDRQLFADINITSVVKGDHANVDRPGLFWQIAEESQKGFVVGLLDELDKAQADAEDALLDTFQSGQVPVAPGKFLQLQLENILIFVTSNGVREHSPAFLRRVQRVRMRPLPPDQVDQIVVERTGKSSGLIGRFRAVANEIATAESSYVSPQEIVNLVAMACEVAESIEDVRHLLAQWAAKSPQGEQVARHHKGAAGIWSLICESRRS